MRLKLSPSLNQQHHANVAAKFAHFIPKVTGTKQR